MSTWAIRTVIGRYVTGIGDGIALSNNSRYAIRFKCSRAEILFTIKGLEEISQAYKFEPEEICT